MSMKYLIIFRGDFSGNVAGVAVRYISIARWLVAAGNQVTIAGRTVPEEETDISYLDVRRVRHLLAAIAAADRIILHGGGPFIIMLLALYSTNRRRVILDAIAPHWLELFSANRTVAPPVPGTFKITLKIIFNYFRLVLARLFFYGISIGTQRQLDLVRGIVVQTGDIDLDRGLFIVTGGCDDPIDITRPPKQGLTLGWLGGLWDWFDERPVIDSIIKLNAEGYAVDIHFYGVPENKRDRILSYVRERGACVAAFVFNNWAPYATRFDTWAHIDATIVWSEPTLENDYASRTRNFDCITLGIPVVQNRDSFWAGILEQTNSGLVVDSVESIADAIRQYVMQPELLELHAQNIKQLGQRFSWKKIAADYEKAFTAGGLVNRSKITAVIALPFLAIATLVSFGLRLRLGKTAR